jgi:hypothetical protein
VRPELTARHDGHRPPRARPFGRRLAELFVVLVAVQVLFFALLVAAQLVPDDPIVTNLNEAVEDGIYGPNGRPDNMGSTSTSFDECVAVGTGLGRPDLNPFERAARMPRIGNCATGPDDLARLAAGEQPANVSEYFRYWAGWTVLSRPTLALWGIDALRRVAGALLVVSAAAFLVTVGRRTTKVYALALVAPLLLASNVLATPSTSLNQTITLSAAFLSPTLVAIGSAWGGRGLVIGAVIGAAVYNYVDLMLVPAIPWMLCTAAAVAITFVRTGTLRAASERGAAVAIVWPLAFAFTWATRWALAIVLLGWGHATSVIRDKIEFRLGGESTAVRPGLGPSTQRNLEYWLTEISTAWAVLLTAIVVVVVAVVVAYRRFGPSRISLFALLALPACLAFVWYELVRNHSQIHPGKAHMSIPVALGVVVAAALFAAADVGRRDLPPAAAGADAGPADAPVVDAGPSVAR